MSCIFGSTIAEIPPRADPFRLALHFCLDRLLVVLALQRPERPAPDILCDVGLSELAPNEALGVVGGVREVACDLALCGVADELALAGER